MNIFTLHKKRTRKKLAARLWRYVTGYVRNGTSENRYILRQMASENRRLRQMLDDAETAARRKDEFLATLAHELRNPIAPLQNALSIVSLPHAPEDMRQKSHAIMGRQLRLIARLVDDLLDVSRIAQNKIQLDRKHLLLSDIIRNAVETVSPVIEEKRHTLKVDLPAHDVYLDADFIRMSQIFANVLHNAAKYTPKGGRITVDAVVEGGNLKLRIADNGIGISPELMSPIFDIFKQGDNPLERGNAGLGIGLALVRNLLEKHGGTITAESAGIGRGSTFTIVLPVLDIKQDGVHEETDVKDTAPLKRALKIIVVDDNTASAQTVGWMLESIGHRAHVMFSGNDILAKAMDIRPDAILLDIGMPGKNGYDICRELRQLPEMKAVCMIAQTGWGREKDKTLSAEAGFNHHLVKPFKLDDLTDILNGL